MSHCMSHCMSHYTSRYMSHYMSHYPLQGTLKLVDYGRTDRPTDWRTLSDKELLSQLTIWNRKFAMNFHVLLLHTEPEDEGCECFQSYNHLMNNIVSADEFCKRLLLHIEKGLTQIRNQIFATCMELWRHFRTLNMQADVNFYLKVPSVQDSRVHHLQQLSLHLLPPHLCPPRGGLSGVV